VYATHHSFAGHIQSSSSKKKLKSNIQCGPFYGHNQSLLLADNTAKLGQGQT
jgi:hypothetical protein